jgi:hypothetical protein
MIRTINIVEYDGEIWFDLDGLRFDTLHAMWELDRKELHLVRDSNHINKASVSEARGEPCFYSTNSGISMQGSSLHAENFKVGDTLLLDTPENLDLVTRLKDSCGFQEALIAVMPVGQSMSGDELKEILVPELERKRETMNEATVLRFRRNRLASK